MTWFIDLRINDSGGDVAPQPTVKSGSRPAKLTDLQSAIRGRHVLIGTHGYNVSRPAGIEGLSNWEGLLKLDSNSIFVGLLWPGDSSWLPFLDYPAEPTYADRSGTLLGPWLDRNLGGAASISFASHSLGARTVLQTIKNMKRRVRRVILMAGAIDNTCLNGEFRSVTSQIDKISVLASTQDYVLAIAFPLGNPIGGILTVGHPWYHEALGRSGPSAQAPSNFVPPFEIPPNWDYGHLDYLGVHPLPPPVALPLTAEVLPPPSPPPAIPLDADGWKEAWSAEFTSSRFV